MPNPPIERLRAICLALPDAVERETWDRPTFRVEDRIFAMASENGGVAAVTCKAPPGSQAVLIGADPGRFYRPPYVGHKGWVGMRLEPEPDWNEVAALIARSFRLVAPKRLAARLSLAH